MDFCLQNLSRLHLVYVDLTREDLNALNFLNLNFVEFEKCETRQYFVDGTGVKIKTKELILDNLDQLWLFDNYSLTKFGIFPSYDSNNFFSTIHLSCLVFCDRASMSIKSDVIFYAKKHFSLLNFEFYF